MAIVLVGNTKGGCSKSTIVTNLAVLRALTGRKVMLVDCDRGQSAAKWASRRALLEVEPAIEFSTLYGKAVHTQIRRLAALYDDVLIDAGGEGEGAEEMRLALVVSDTVVTPCRTDPADILRTAAMDALVNEARGINENLRALLLPTQASTHPSAKDVIEFYRDAAEYSAFQPAETVMRVRNAYKKWPKTGLSVIEQTEDDDKALTELQAIYHEVFQ